MSPLLTPQSVDICCFMVAHRETHCKDKSFLLTYLSTKKTRLFKQKKLQAMRQVGLGTEVKIQDTRQNITIKVGFEAQIIIWWDSNPHSWV